MCVKFIIIFTISRIALNKYFQNQLPRLCVYILYNDKKNNELLCRYNGFGLMSKYDDFIKFKLNLIYTHIAHKITIKFLAYPECRLSNIISTGILFHFGEKSIKRKLCTSNIKHWNKYYSVVYVIKLDKELNSYLIKTSIHHFFMHSNDVHSNSYKNKVRCQKQIFSIR